LNYTSAASSKPAGDNVSFLSEHGGLKDSFMDDFLSLSQVVSTTE
jgi:hypothetical protein